MRRLCRHHRRKASGHQRIGIPHGTAQFRSQAWRDPWRDQQQLRGCTRLVPGLCLAGMSDVTRILQAIDAGDPTAAGQLLPLVYAELRKLAAQKLASEKPGQTLEATA